MKKQFLALAMAAMMAASLAGCSSKPAETKAPETAAETQEAAGETTEAADESAEETKEEAAAGGVLVMGTNAEFPP